MSIFSRFLPKRKPPELKNNIPKEKENIRKTFGVYCSKLAEQSREATERIQVTLNEMNRAVEDISKSIETTGSISEQQAASTQEITANLSRVTRAADELKGYIRSLA